MTDMQDVKRCMVDSNEEQLTWRGSDDTQWTWGMLNGARQTQMKHDGHVGR